MFGPRFTMKKAISGVIHLVLDSVGSLSISFSAKKSY